MRFQKRIKLCKGLNLNLSKSGVGFSAGINGLRIGLDSKGKAYSSVGIPGTGISQRNYYTLSKKKKQSNSLAINNKRHTDYDDFEDSINAILENPDNQQDIIDEYIKKQEDSDLMLCIYEEKNSGDDIEWFLCNGQWSYFQEKEEKDKETGEYYDCIKLIQRTTKKFPKTKSHVEKISFTNYMYMEFCKYKGIDEFSTHIASLYMQGYLEYKKEFVNSNVDEYNEYLDEQEKEFAIEQENRAAFEFFKQVCWIVVIIAFLLKLYWAAILFCPLLWKLFNSIIKTIVGRE